ncbi:YIP1 family protein [Oscillochloris sp. ZM17-4]|uniref:YIP1 family protein n=1 Tax=Oscillochloris sp. ZM17-4 TaxID=2866714 RepID=UPI001C73672D|nr:YIP1 family protein [Oscillochloris sp. ZM17-4]MBX0328553.1 YIP1 family protein [Oscillochloris sp. ZM17-4]
MQSVLSLFRLGLDGLLLNPEAYRDQRDAPDGLRRGFVLVTIIGLLVGFAAMVGNLGEYASQPSSEAIAQTIHDGLRAMPWFGQLSELDSQFPAQFDTIFAQITQIIQATSGGGLIGSLTGVITTPLLMLVGWLIFGSVAHLMARALGGRAAFSQTLACTALAAGVNILGIVQVIPFAQVAGTTLLGLVASYVAVREAHALPPWSAFWATMLGPAILLLILIGLACVGVFLGIGAISSALQGGL